MGEYLRGPCGAVVKLETFCARRRDKERGPKAYVSSIRDFLVRFCPFLRVRAPMGPNRFSSSRRMSADMKSGPVGGVMGAKTPSLGFAVKW